MVPVECVVRGYITGSGWKDYQSTGAVCGIQLPEGLEESQQLPEPIFTPATKAEVGDHDENVDFDRAAEIVGDRALLEELRRLSTQIYEFAAGHAREHGILLADTKFEFGRRPDGTIVLGDEVLTPDSSRFWPASDTSRVARSRASTSSTCATGPPRRAGTSRRPRRRPPRWSTAPGRATWRPTSASPASRSSAGSSGARGMTRARVLIRPKEGILDPQGQAVERALPALGFEGVTNVRVGRLVELEVEDASQVPAMCERLLANPLIEDYDVHVVEEVSSGRMPIAHIRTRGWKPRGGDHPYEVRRHPLPRQLRRGRRPARLPPLRRRRAALACGPRPPRGGRGRDSRRLLLRRLPARRRDRALLAGDGAVGEFALAGGPVLGTATASRSCARRAASAPCSPTRAAASSAGRSSSRWSMRTRPSRAHVTRTPRSIPISTPPAAITRRRMPWTSSRRTAGWCSATRPAATQRPLRDIAAYATDKNVMGLMPHPARGRSLRLGDGGRLFESLAAHVTELVAAA